MGDDSGWNMPGGSGGSFSHVFGPHGCAWVVGGEEWHPAGHFGFFGRRTFVRRRVPFSLDRYQGPAGAPGTLKHPPPLFLGSRNGLDRQHGAR